MQQDDLFGQFLAKLRRGKSEEEVRKFLANLVKFGASELYFTIVSFLNDEDVTAVEKITDDSQAEAELANRFKLRVGMTPEEFVGKLRDQIAQNYLHQA